MNVWRFIYEEFSNDTNRVAFSLENEDITYGLLTNHVRSIGEYLKSRTSRFDKIAFLNDITEFDAICFLSILAINRVAIPLSLKYGEQHCKKIIETADPHIIITNVYQKLISSIAEGWVKGVEHFDFGNTTFYICYGESTTTDNSLDEVAAIMFTSGTTGKPKGSMLTHNNLISNIQQIDSYFQLKPDDRILIIRPIYHIAVATGELLVGLYRRCTFSFYSEMFQPLKILKKLEDCRSTIMCCTPTIMYHIARQKRSSHHIELRKVILSGECIKSEIVDVISRQFPEISFLNVYGLTESSPRLTYLDETKFFRKPGSVGCKLLGVTIEIIDIETEAVLQNGRIGEIRVKGPNIFKGYYNNYEETKKKKKNDWLYTGDMGYIDQDGDLFIVGRKDNMLIKAGINIYPEYLESVVMECPYVQEALVWGEYNVAFGVKICMQVVREQGKEIDEKYVLQYCSERLSSVMVPDEIIFVEQLSRNGSGKIIRNKMHSGRGVHVKHSNRKK